MRWATSMTVSNIARYILLVYAIAFTYQFSSNSIPYGFGVHETLVPYVRSFELEGQRHLGPKFRVKNIDIGFGTAKMIDLEGDNDTVGFCDVVMPRRLIIIDLDYFKRRTEAEREELIFHELGHCILNRDHEELKDEHGPISIMYPYTLGESTYAPMRDRYITELFINTDEDTKKKLTQ